MAFVLLALIWGLAWPIMKMSLDYAEPFSFAALRAVLSAVVLLGAVAVSRRSLKPPPLGWTALLGLFQTAGFAGLGLWALETGGAGKTSVLAYTMPFWLLMMAWLFLGEKVRGLQWLAVGLAFVGLMFILSPWALQGVASSLLAIATGFAWAAGAVVAKIIHKRHRVDVLSLTAWQMLLGAVPLVVVAFATGYETPDWSACLRLATGLQRASVQRARVDTLALRPEDPAGRDHGSRQSGQPGSGSPLLVVASGRTAVTRRSRRNDVHHPGDSRAHPARCPDRAG